MPTVLITGASRGLGLEFTKQYSQSGWNVVACARRPKDATALTQLAKARPDRVQIFALDVTEAASVNTLARDLKDAAVDVLLNNAGVYGDTFGSSFTEADSAAWLKTFHTNAIAPIELTRALLPHIRRGAQKKLVYITSQMGSVGDNKSGGSIIYRTSKAALNMAVKCVALELAEEGVTASVLHPGWVQTDMGGAQAPMVPSESIRGLISVIEKLSPQDSGRFLNYRGEELPW